MAVWAHCCAHDAGGQLPSSNAAYSSKVSAVESVQPPMRQLPSTSVPIPHDDSVQTSTICVQPGV